MDIDMLLGTLLVPVVVFGLIGAFALLTSMEVPPEAPPRNAGEGVRSHWS